MMSHRWKQKQRRTRALNLDVARGEEFWATSQKTDADVGEGAGKSAEDVAAVSGTNHSKNEGGRRHD
jgi:hypothetical protein